MAEDRAPTLLLIDNDDGVLAAVKTRFEHLGYVCITAMTGAQGIAAFRNEKIDIIVTDFNMPTLDGLGVVQTARAIDPHVPIVVLTGYRREFCKRLEGYDDVQVVSKPCRARDLIDIVEAELFLRPDRMAA